MGILRKLFSERVSYRPGPFRCGSCGEELEFMYRRWPLPGAWYVHADGRRLRCANGRADALTAPLRTP